MMRSSPSHCLRNAARLSALPGKQHVHSTNTIRHASQSTRSQRIFASFRSLQQSPTTISSSWARPRALRTKLQPRNHSTNKQRPEITSQLGSPAAKPGLQAKLKELFKKYGYLSVGVYLALSALDLPLCFLAVRMAGPERIGQFEHQILSSVEPYTKPVWGMVEPVAGPAIHAVKEVFATMWKGAVRIAGFESDHNAEQNKSGAASIWTQLALAYGIHKTLLIFIRVPLTAAFTPKIARTLQKRGWKVGSSAS